MNNNNYLIIMAGGVGSRFWPMSTEEKPKQFLDVLGIGKTLLQQTVTRFKTICPPENILVVTAAKYKGLVMEQCPELLEQNVLLEPCMRNTAPCIAYACYKIKESNPEANIVVAPSDHLIANEAEFIRIIENGLEFTANKETLLTLGIQPHRPETGYGYIQAELEGQQSLGTSKVASFREKPDRATAEKYLASGDFFWNSGIFLWSLKSILKAFENDLPEVAACFAKGEGIYNTEKEQEFIDKMYPECINISIDYGVMEKADNIYVQPADFGWSDLGTWGSLWEKRDRSEEGNTVVGEKVHLFEASNCIVNMPKDKKVVIQGLNDFIVVEENDTLLVCKKEEEQRIKEFRASVLES
jgi:mannose-1-phosphate guanylyltransferase